MHSREIVNEMPMISESDSEYDSDEDSDGDDNEMPMVSESDSEYDSDDNYVGDDDDYEVSEYEDSEYNDESSDGMEDSNEETERKTSIKQVDNEFDRCDDNSNSDETKNDEDDSIVLPHEEDNEPIDNRPFKNEIETVPTIDNNPSKILLTNENNLFFANAQRSLQEWYERAITEATDKDSIPAIWITKQAETTGSCITNLSLTLEPTAYKTTIEQIFKNSAILQNRVCATFNLLTTKLTSAYPRLICSSFHYSPQIIWNPT